MVVEPMAPTHKFLDKKNTGMLALNVLFLAADVVYTERAMKVPGSRELNPLAQSQSALISLKVAGAGAGLGMAYVMHRTGHHRAERTIPMLFGLPSLLAAGHNAAIHR